MDKPFHRILHPTDFSAASQVAFVHALKIALAMRGKLTLLHVTAEDAEAEWGDFPGVRDTLHTWGLLPAGAHHQDVATLGLAVRKVLAEKNDPVEACLDLMEGHPADLIVLATSQGKDRARWLGGDVSGPLSREAGLPTLFIPAGAKGFVDPGTGSLNMDRILMPLSMDPSPREALPKLAGLLEALGVTATVTLLHVGNEGGMPALEDPRVKGVTWERRCVEGEVVPSILAAAAGSDLIAMATDGRSGFLEALRGSHTERVLRSANCPLLALPV
jgi:nucleotide-binding universal stress UspA family protein